MSGKKIFEKAYRLIGNETQKLRRFVRTEHICGPKIVKLGDDEVMLVALVKNAAYYISFFIKHHLQLGVRHILLIDNGSTDNTVQAAEKFKNITILRNSMPAQLHETQLRSELARRVARGGWILFVDADELIELPLAKRMSLTSLVNYCNEHDYTAVVGQMLDHFSSEPYSRICTLDYMTAIPELKFHSLEMIDSIDYFSRTELPFSYFIEGNVCEDRGVQFKRGGIRRELFGEDPFLSKHSLVRNCAGVSLMTHPHCASGVKVADVTMLLHHYKLAGDWVKRDADSVRQGVWRHGEDRQRLNSVGNALDFRLAATRAKQWENVDKLREDGFIYVSSAFIEDLC